jgi:hypothetical protein
MCLYGVLINTVPNISFDAKIHQMDELGREY